MNQKHIVSLLVLTAVGSSVIATAVTSMLSPRQAAIAVPPQHNQRSIASATLPSMTKSSASDVLTPDEKVNVNVYKTANKSVVYITTTTPTKDAFLRIVPSKGEGSGSILTSDGYILTNYHVVKGAQVVNVTLWDGTILHADITGVDPEYDVAVIKVDPGNKVLSVMSLGDSTHLEVGRRVFVIGNPFGFDRTMTSGIVSMIGRSMTSVGGRVIKGMIQTDAAINPGNSGGPLLNTRGEMIGMTTAIYSRLGDANAQWAGIGLAIPINTVKAIFPQLIEHHHVIRPDLGIQSVQPTNLGLRVSALVPNGPAAQAGIQPIQIKVTQNGPFTIQQVDANSADIITAVDDKKVSNTDDLLSYLESKKTGQVVTLTVLRLGKILKIPVKLQASSPAE